MTHQIKSPLPLQQPNMETTARPVIQTTQAAVEAEMTDESEVKEIISQPETITRIIEINATVIV